MKAYSVAKVGECMLYISVDDITIEYSKAGELKKDAISEVLRSDRFLLQTKNRTVMGRSTLESTGDLVLTMLLQLEEEFGKVFTSAMASALLTRFDKNTVAKIAGAAIKHLEDGEEPK